MIPSAGLPLTALKGVGPALAKTLERLSLHTFGDLLLHLPYRYEDRSRCMALNLLEPGHTALVEGEILRADIVIGRKRALRCVIADGTGTLSIRFFHFNRGQESVWRPGRWVRAFGEARHGPQGLEMIHPDCRAHDTRPPPPPPGLTPVYPTTRGLGQLRIRSLAAAVAGLEWPAPSGSPLPDLIRLHRPEPADSEETLRQARERLALDELTAYHLVMRHRQSLRAHQTTRALPRGPQLGRALLNSLGFELTGAQRRVVREILEDLTQATPMLRLLQGDVGSGKTVVAAFAAVRAAEHGAQTAVLAPTEILAEQHHASLSRWLDPLGISVVLLTGSLPGGRQKEVAREIAEGRALVAVGTHALVQSRVEFANLALCIVDEQHRFGVHQRMALREKGLQPHQLIMTATPIPRTLTMAMYADMSVSVIDELPRGRQPITTRAVPTTKREEVMRLLRQVLAARAQAYWVCPLIEEGEIPGLAAATTVAAELAAELPEFSTGLLHGRLSTAEKAEVMSRFKSGEIDLLVATTVVEVGVDVPNATLMVIENPERLGLAQLHQLRGRVGRGSRPSTCLLFYAPPLGAVAQARLATIRETQDGFLIAERDLALRGPGEVLGTRQTGEVGFRVADLGEHAHLLPTALARADELLAAGDPAIQVLLSAWAPAERGASNV